jgi:hypothetical protein
MGGAGVEFEEGEAESFAGFWEGTEGGEEDVLENLEGSAGDFLDDGLGLGFAQRVSRRPWLV